MSSKTCSLAVEELAIQNHNEVEFEPELKVLINKRYVKDSHSNVKEEPIAVRGRITISF